MTRSSKTRKKNGSPGGKPQIVKKLTSEVTKQSIDSNSASTSTSNDANTTYTTELPYILEKAKALQKKIDSSQQSTPSTITVKGNENNPQLVIICSAATYEWIKSEFQKCLKCYNVTTTIQEDKVGSQVTVTNKTSRNNKKGYTINFFNSTSKILVNGGSAEVNLFMKQYEDMVNNMPRNEIDSLDAKIKDVCETELIRSRKRHMDASPDERSSSSLADHSTSVTSMTSADKLQGMICDKAEDSMNTSPSMHNKITESIPSADSKIRCNVCPRLKTTVDLLLAKVAKLENKICQQDLTLASIQATSITKEHLKNEFAIYTRRSSENLETQLKVMSNSISNEIKQLKTSYADASKRVFNTHANSNNYSQAPHPTSNQNRMDTNQPTTSQNNSNTSPQTMSSSNHQKNIPKHPTTFIGQNNIVVSLKPNSNIHTNFNQDMIRKAINIEHGPTIIELISRYGFKSNTPRIMIQFRSRDIADSINNKWNKSLFEGSTSRLSINPDTHKENCVILKGIPLDADDEDVSKDVKTIDKLASIERLIKNGKKLRSFKVKFSQSKYCQESISNGIYLPTVHILCHAEALK